MRDENQISFNGKKLATGHVATAIFIILLVVPWLLLALKTGVCR